MRNILAVALMVSIATFTRTACFGGSDFLDIGVHFEQGLSWKQILAKAKAENKYIFVDCFATWCGPCKRMEQDVYSRPDVGMELNGKFISVKAQLDTSKVDNQTTRLFYADAHYIGRQYDIRLYPTLLFFNPDGKILNRVSGALEANDFKKLVIDVLDPSKDYYTLLERYRKGEKNLVEMGYLARTALGLLHDTIQADAIAKDYIHSMQEGNQFSVENIEFTNEFTHHSQDAGFSFVYENMDSIDDIMRNGNYAQEFIHRILYAEIIQPIFLKCKETKTTPNWNEVAAEIGRKYSDYFVKRLVLGAQTDWSASQNDWAEHTKDLIQFVETYGPKTDTGGRFEAVYLNNFAWDIFEHSSNASELNVARRWSLRAVMIDPIPDWMDTYANILYKLGRKSDALKWEGVAVALAPKYEPVLSTFASMKAGKPTWDPN